MSAKARTRSKAKTAPVVMEQLPAEERLKARAKEIETQWYLWTRDARQVWDEKLYKNIEGGRFKDFKSYVEDYVGVSYRVTMWRFKILALIDEHGVTLEQIENIGWSKVKEIASLVDKTTTKAQLQEYLDYARNNSFRKVAKWVKEQRRIDGGGPVADETTITRTYLDEQAEIVEAAEQKALAKLGLDPDNDIHRNRASEFIHLTFLQLNQDETSKMAEKLAQKLHEAPEAGKVKRGPYQKASGGNKAAPKKAPAKKKAPARKKAPAKKAAPRKRAAKK